MSSNKDRKFLFDTNNFDLPDLPPEPEIYVEPPPLFSLDEIGDARNDAFEKGHAAGLEEARVAREQFLAEQTEKISQELKFLLGAENYRAAVYEREVLSLSETIFSTLFPAFTEREGLAEIKTVIAKVLAGQPEQPSIIIELPAEDCAAIEEYFTHLGFDPSRITFKSTPSLPRASCRIAWKDGGALRDHQAIADQILKTLRPGQTGHADTSESPAPPLANGAEKDETELDSQGE